MQLPRSPRRVARGLAGTALLLAASLLCVAAPFACAQSAPLVVAPAEVAASTSVSVRVHGAASAGGLRVALVDTSGSSSPTIVASAVAAATNGDAQTLVLDVPSGVDATKDDYEIRLFPAADASTPLARHDVRVSARSPSASSSSSAASTSDTASHALILETDKPQYRPGQSVRARALALDAHSLRPAAGATTFTFRDPNGFVAMRVTETADAHGVASASLPTSPEPTLGDWAVEASFAETGAAASATPVDAASARFALEKYVLPTYEVAVALRSQSVIRGVGTIEGTVAATYTHGARVAGTVDLSVWQKTAGGGGEIPMFADAMMMREDEPVDSGPGPNDAGFTDGTYRLVKQFPPIDLASSDEDGVAFELDLSDASLGVDYGWGGWGGGSFAPELLVEATARDASTGETQTDTAAATPRYRAFEVTIEGPSLFKPGIDAELVFRAESLGAEPDPVVGAFDVTTTFFKSDGSSSAVASAIELTEADAGSKRFYVRVPLNDPTCCERDDLTRYRSGSCCLNGARAELDRDAPSLRTVAESVAAGAGDVSDFAPHASWYAQMAPPVGVLDAFVSIHGVSLERVAVGTVVTATVESSFDPPGGAFDWAVVAPGSGVTHSGSVARGGTLSFTTTDAMRHDATLVAYVAHDGSGGEADNVVACAKKIGVTYAADAAAEFGLPETLSLALNASEAAPGDAVRLTANSSAPGSRVFVLAHDVSVLIQSGGRQSAMSASKILEATAAAGGAGAGAGAPFDPTNMAASRCYPPADVDASELVLLTAMETSSCDPAEREMMLFAEDAVMADAGVPEMASARDDVRGASEAAEAETSSDGDSGGTAVRTRRFFPETWVWESLDVDAATGVGALDDLRAPDTITSWRFRAFATHPEKGVAAAAADAAAATLTVAKPFFVRPILPYSAVRGESLVVKAGVYNALARNVTATIQMKTAVDCDDDASGTRLVGSPVTVAVRAGSFASVTFAAFASTSLGEVPVTFVATTELADIADAVQKTIRVVPEGFAVTETVNALARRGASDGDAASVYALSVPLPDASRVVPDSITSRVTVIGDAMGPSIGGLERLVRVPFGCGEQNMITLAPNVAAVKYLAATGKLSSDIKKRAADNVLTGYQRQLTYRHDDGSFSAFGPSTASPSGSLWLTAFVLRVFADAKRVPALGVAAASIDDAVVAAAAAFVAASQNADGSFADPAPVIHAEMAGGAGAGLGLAAYCLLAMVEGGRSGANVDATVAYVAREAARRDASGKNAFVVAVAARALTRACVFASKGCDEAAAARAEMMTFAVAGDDGTTLFWGEDRAEPDDAGTSSLRGFPRPAAVEATAYACSALVESGDLATAHLAARWLMLRRNDLGGFRSTQDTVVGLEALAAYAAAIFDDDANLTVVVNAGAAAAATASSCSASPPGGYATSPVSVSRETFDVMRVIDTGAASAVDVSVTGSGTAVVTLSVTYHLAEPAPGAYGAEVEARAVAEARAARRRRRSCLSAGSAGGLTDASDADAIEMTACVTRPGPGSPRGDADAAGMLVARVGVFTGFAPTEASLAKIRADGGAFARRVDWSADENEVVLYLEGTAFDAAHPLCVTFEVVKRTPVSELRRATHTVQHYYRPDVASQATTAATSLRTISRSETRAATGASSVTVGGVAATEFDASVSRTPEPFEVSLGFACVGAVAAVLFY